MKILVADDHPLFRKGLRQLLADALSPEVILEAENGREALDAIQQTPVDILILDVGMPVLDGFGVLAELRRLKNPTPAVLLTMYKEEAVFQKAMDLGIRGFLVKEDAVSDILHCVETVLKGKFYISSSLSDFMLKHVSRKADSDATAESLDALTQTERRILKLLSQMKTSRQIAEELFISVKTVNNHRNNICDKLDLQGSHSLLKFALENKMVL